MDWNRRNVIDCSLSHPAGQKPFTRSHRIRTCHVTYQLRLVLNAFFCLPLFVRIYDTAAFCMSAFLVFLSFEVCRERVRCPKNQSTVYQDTNAFLWW